MPRSLPLTMKCTTDNTHRINFVLTEICAQMVNSAVSVFRRGVRNRKRFVLLAFQRLHGVFERGFDRLVTDGEHSHGEGNQAGNEYQFKVKLNPVRKAFKPSRHSIPGDRDGDDE